MNLVLPSLLRMEAAEDRAGRGSEAEAHAQAGSVKRLESVDFGYLT